MATTIKDDLNWNLRIRIDNITSSENQAQEMLSRNIERKMNADKTKSAIKHKKMQIDQSMQYIQEKLRNNSNE